MPPLGHRYNSGRWRSTRSVLHAPAFARCQTLRDKITALSIFSDVSGLSPDQCNAIHTIVLSLRTELHTALRESAEIIATSLRNGQELPFDSPAALGDEYRAVIHTVDNLERILRYAKEGKHMWPLLAVDTAPRLPFARCVRNYVAARTNWLHERKFGSEPLFPSRGRDRYAGDSWPHLELAEDQLSDLPKRLRWLVDTSGPLRLSPNAEWGAILELVGGVTAMEHGGCMECPIGMEAFSDDGVDEHEPAVKTVCGHFVGRMCLQMWTDAAAESGSEDDDIECPTCRTALIIGQFPIQVQPIISEYVTYLRSDRDLDEEVDKFLLHAEEKHLSVCYGPEVGVMLTKLHKRFREGTELLRKCYQVFEVYCPDKTIGRS